MTLMALLIRLRACEVALECDGDKLRYRATPGLLTLDDKQAIKEHKQALMRLPHAYLNAAGELIVPCDALPQYHWQPKTKTLREVGASPKEWRTHTTEPYPDDMLPETPQVPE